MHIKFVNPGFEYMLESFMGFQKDDSAAFWNQEIYAFCQKPEPEIREHILRSEDTSY